MEELFLSKELSIMAKEAGFDKGCFSYYYKNNPNICRFREGVSYNEDLMIRSPLYDQIFNWLEEKYNIHIEVVKEIHNGVKGYDISISKFMTLNDKNIVGYIYNVPVSCENKKSGIDTVLKKAFELIKNN